METNTLLWSGAAFVLALFIREWFSGLRRGQNEVSDLRGELKELAIVVGSLKTSMDHFSDRMAQPQPPPQLSALGTIRDILSLLQLAKDAGFIRITAA